MKNKNVLKRSVKLLIVKSVMMKVHVKNAQIQSLIKKIKYVDAKTIVKNVVWKMKNKNVQVVNKNFTWERILNVKVALIKIVKIAIILLHYHLINV